MKRQFRIPEKLFPQIVPSGKRLGPLPQELCDETGLGNVEVIATCSHDTGAAVRAQDNDGAYLSSGMWSLIGVELPSPLINHDVQEFNFTNEIEFGGTTRFLKNIIGLWLSQELRHDWARQGQSFDYAEINRLAEQAEPFRSLINPNAARFLKPDNMPGKITDYCRETDQPVPTTPGQVARCILESLTLLYRQALDDIEHLTGRKISRLHIVGGGSQSTLLNQCTANATDRTVLAGPVEATAIGNLLIQAIAFGDLDSLESVRSVVHKSFTIETWEPERSPEWKRAHQRFATLDLTA